MHFRAPSRSRRLDHNIAQDQVAGVERDAERKKKSKEEGARVQEEHLQQIKAKGLKAGDPVTNGLKVGVINRIEKGELVVRFRFGPEQRWSPEFVTKLKKT